MKKFYALISAASLVLAIAAPNFAVAASSLRDVIRSTQAKVVKIYGAGGFRGLEAYQSGFVVSGAGHVVTVWSYVLDTDEIIVTLNDGRRLKAEIVGVDPSLELAVLKIDAPNLKYFSRETPVAKAGDRVLAFSNLFGIAAGDEPVSVQHGVVSAKGRLEARRGVFETAFRGDAYILDAMTNNPGAAGGAVTDMDGRLLGMLGKELRNSQTNTWVNYSAPMPTLWPVIDAIISGKHVRAPADASPKKPAKAWSLELAGIVLVPDVVVRTPPFIDETRDDTPAGNAGLRPDDLVLFVNGKLMQSCKAVLEELSFLDQADPIRLAVLRGQELIEVTLEIEKSVPVKGGA